MYIIQTKIHVVDQGLDSGLNAIVVDVEYKIIKPTKDRREIYKKPLEELSALKQTIDQNNMFYYLLFSRHPIDVLRMSDHKGISSCHRLGGGKYSSDEGMFQNCALADAKNDGGIVYIIRGGDAEKIKKHLNDKEVFEDRDRDTGIIQPLGRIRLRRFVDLQTGKDFAVPDKLINDQKYGLFTKEIYDEMINYIREHQSIFKNPPDIEYAKNNIVMVGGDYDDSDLSDLLNNLFQQRVVAKDDPSKSHPFYYRDIKHVSGTSHGWEQECQEIYNELADQIKPYHVDYSINRAEGKINVTIVLRLEFKIDIKRYEKAGSVKPKEIAFVIQQALESKGIKLSFYRGTKSEERKAILDKNSSSIIYTDEIKLQGDDPEILRMVMDNAVKMGNLTRYYFLKDDKNPIYLSLLGNIYYNQ